MIYELPCPHCSKLVSASDDVVGLRVRCPHCQGEFVTPEPKRSTLETPVAQEAAQVTNQAVAAPPMSAPATATSVPTATMPHARFHFHCPLCDSVLEATTEMSGRNGTCPSCATILRIPALDTDTGRLSEIRVLHGDVQDPTPVHAYAAAGALAPKIVRDDAGEAAIVCPRCESRCPVEADRCEACGLPFTLEGVTYERPGGTSNGHAVLSLVFALVGLPCFALVVPQILAVTFGVIAIAQIGQSSHKKGMGMALAGIIIGAISLMFTVLAMAG